MSIKTLPVSTDRTSTMRLINRNIFQCSKSLATLGSGIKKGKGKINATISCYFGTNRPICGSQINAEIHLPTRNYFFKNIFDPASYLAHSLSFVN